MRLNKLFSFTVLVFLASGIGFADVAASGASSLADEYQQAVQITHHHQLPSEPLQVLTKGSVVEMLTWTTHPYSMGSQILSHEVWAVEASEMKAHCEALLAAKDPTLRVNQLLGMPPRTEKISPHFVLIQVPVDAYLFKASQNSTESHLVGEIIRPCFSSGDVSEKSCRYVAQSEGSAVSPYQQWIENIQSETQGYPWTGLGYTYDWSPKNPSHIGLSEFILPVGASVKVERITTAQELCSSI